MDAFERHFGRKGDQDFACLCSQDGASRWVEGEKSWSFAARIQKSARASFVVPQQIELGAQRDVWFAQRSDDELGTHELRDAALAGQDVHNQATTPFDVQGHDGELFKGFPPRFMLFRSGHLYAY